MSSFLQSFEDFISTFGNELFGLWIAQRSHKVCVSVNLLAGFLKIFLFGFPTFLSVAKNL